MSTAAPCEPKEPNKPSVAVSHLPIAVTQLPTGQPTAQ